MSKNGEDTTQDIWWSKKIEEKYDVQPKHLAAIKYIDVNSFPLLDVGAGPGVFLGQIENGFPGANVSGIEMSQEAVKRKLCKAPIQCAEIFSWEGNATYRTVSLIDVIEHLQDPASALKKINKICTHLIVACPNFNFLGARFDMLLGRIPFQNRVGRGGHIYWCQYDSLLALFRSAGFVVRGENHLFPKNESSLLRFFLRLFPSVFAHEFVFFLEKKNDL